MSKIKKKYICSNCGYESLKWLGKCPTCDSWSSFSEELLETNRNSDRRFSSKSFKTYSLNEIDISNEKRIMCGIAEFDRVLGGGLTPGSVVLIGGDPGIGKSTLVMQAASKMNGKALYVTGEESPHQIKQRAKRLNIDSDNLIIAPETDLDSIVSAMRSINPIAVIIDSIQTVYKSSLDNAPGTITQLRECALNIMQEAKNSNQAVLLIGHVTKEGAIAGPKVLEHIVDAVIQFEGEKNHSYRILRAQKNRYGSVNEIGVFEMRENGLREITNPSELFLSQKENSATGSVVTATIEGARPILIETQALVTPSHFGNPQRVATGFDYRRMSILLAVLEKRAGRRFSTTNAFINMAGGVKIDEPAVDLAVCCALVSSMIDKPVNGNFIIIGEVGLGGEVRNIGHIEKRIQEAEKLGFVKAIIPKNNSQTIKSNIEILPVSNINQTFEALFE